ncbi:MAG TPA: MFS transporter [Usitatibacter sp.]|jgi:MFS family permease|nr:MFS transporter [Usitatibacter sp.]
MTRGPARADSREAFIRLMATLAIMTIGASAMYVVPVILPAVQAEFHVPRADASTPYSLLMIGYGVGGLLMGRLADRHGLVVPLVLGAISLGAGYLLAAHAATLGAFTAAHAVLMGFLGSSVTFSPLLADTSLWWEKRRGIAVAVCASGNYLGGAIWPPVVQHFVETAGWRATYTGMGVVCAGSMLLLSLAMRRRPPPPADAPAKGGMAMAVRPFGLTPLAANALLCVAGLACCVAMSMPQVHIVAYCADLGYGPARGARMLALMLGFGIVSRLASGLICDRIGGVRTLLLGSFLQGVALLLFLPFRGLVPLYVISILFGLFQGGIVPSYAIIVREHFPAREAGARVGAVIMCTLVGMALGGWMSGRIFDVTGSYRAAFLNGIAWNAINLSIVLLLLRGAPLRRRLARA